jgi:NADH-quinone oxidoreductase subunit M
MAELHCPWLESAIAIPLVGIVIVARARDPILAWKQSLLVTGSVLLITLCAWADFMYSHPSAPHVASNFSESWLAGNLFAIDEVSAPLLPLSSLI